MTRPTSKTAILTKIADAKRSLSRGANITRRATGIDGPTPSSAIAALEQAAAEATEAANMLRAFVGRVSS